MGRHWKLGEKVTSLLSEIFKYLNKPHARAF